MKNQSLAIFSLLFLFLILGLIGLIKKNQTAKVAEQYLANSNSASPASYHLACPYSGADYLSDKSQVEQKIKASALIVSHHLLAKDLINEALEQTTQDYQVIVLVGPNHLDLGKGEIQTSVLDWKTKFGTLSAQQTLIDQLNQDNLVLINEENFNTEHSVCGLTSFVRKQFPKAELVPLILKSTTTSQQTQKLGQILAQNCSDCLLLLSLDFSHEVSEAQAQINDQKSIEVLTNLKEKNIDEVACDSLPSLQVLFSYLEQKGVYQGKLIANSNSNQISSQNLPTVTSYITMIF